MYTILDSSGRTINIKKIDEIDNRELGGVPNQRRI
jgi:hypothetical protein